MQQLGPDRNKQQPSDNEEKKPVDTATFDTSIGKELETEEATEASNDAKLSKKPYFWVPVWRWVRHDARASDWIIAIFTVVIAVVGYLQYTELASSGYQTDRMIRLYRQQVAQLAKQTSDTHRLAKAAGNQVVGIKESNRINRESLESVQRAFITYKGTQSERMIVPPGKYVHVFSPVFENSGTTPARAAIGAFDCAPHLSSEPNEAMFKGTKARWSTIMTIGPKAIQNPGNKHMDETDLWLRDLGDDPITRLQKAIWMPRSFVWGWVVYKDVFQRTPPHLTEFCEELNGATAVSPGGKVIFDYLKCAHHNCTDEDCPDYREITSFLKADGEKKAAKAN